MQHIGYKTFFFFGCIIIYQIIKENLLHFGYTNRIVGETCCSCSELFVARTSWWSMTDDVKQFCQPDNILHAVTLWRFISRVGILYRLTMTTLTIKIIAIIIKIIIYSSVGYNSRQLVFCGMLRANTNAENGISWYGTYKIQNLSFRPPENLKKLHKIIIYTTCQMTTAIN